jgi:hypothetical protein
MLTVCKCGRMECLSVDTKSRDGRIWYSHIWCILCVPGGKVNILGSHGICHSKQKLCTNTCPIAKGLRDRAISLYSSLDLAPNTVCPSFSHVNRREASFGRCDCWWWHCRVLCKMLHIFTNAEYAVYCPHIRWKFHWGWRSNFRKCVILGKLYQICHLKKYIPVLETVRNISFLSTILELCSEKALSRKVFGIGHYIYTFLLRMTDTITSQSNDLSSLDTLYMVIVGPLWHGHGEFMSIRHKPYPHRQLDSLGEDEI